MRQYCSCEWDDKGDVLTLCVAHQLHAAKALASEREKVSNLRFALANIVDKDMTYDGHFVAAGEIVRAHIHGGRRALKENPV